VHVAEAIAPNPAPRGDPAFWFDTGAADAAVAFFRDHLHFTKDRWAGKPFILGPWQEHDIIRPLFGWKRADGTRRYRRAIVYVPRKNGKTELAAGVALLMLIGDGTFGPEVYAIAKDEQQARIVFDKAATMVGLSPELGRHLTAFKTSIYCPQLQGAIVPLTGKAEGKHGLNASGIIGDETHEWPDERLYTTVHQSSASRLQPLEFLISTAGIRGRCYGWTLWQEARAILDGSRPDPETLVALYGAGPDDDWTDEKVWEKANPNLDVSVSRDYLRSECAKARANPRLENDFRRYHLNQWTEQAIRWIPMEAWDRCVAGLPASQHQNNPCVAGLPAENPCAPGLPGSRDDGFVAPAVFLPRWRDESGLAGKLCYGGLDLASTSDIAALAYVFPGEGERDPVRVLWRLFVPEETVGKRAREARVPYDLWVREGALIATPGNVTDYEYILRRLLEDASTFDLALLGVDRWNSSHFITRVTDEGFDRARIGLVGQGYASLSAPSKEFERLVMSGRLDHGGHPVARWAAGNVAIEQDPAGNIKPAKNRSADKIDPIAAAIDALFCLQNAGLSQRRVARGFVDLRG
jgi:phage terminase large subunit-like protein